MEMGCHGIGVSRLIAAVAEEYRSPAGVGLGWPRCIAPFEVIIVPGDSKKGDFSGKEGVDSEKVYDVLSGKRDGGEEIDVLLDDRTKSFAWKIKDADLIGYPVVVILGRKWKSNGEVEVQCNRKKLRKYVPLEELRELVVSLLSEL